MRPFSRGWAPYPRPQRPVRLGAATVLMAAAVAFGCATGSAPAVPEEGPAPIVLTLGPTSRADEAQADRLYQAALEDFEADRLTEAAAAASTVVEDFAATRVSGASLWLLARVHERSGQPDAALGAATRYATALPPEDTRLGIVRLLQARALSELDRPAEATRQILSIPVDAPADVRSQALDLVRAFATQLDREELGDLLSATPLGQPLAAPLMVTYARVLRLGGDPDGAREYAQAALAAGAEGSDQEQADALLADLGGAGAADVPTVRIAALLSSTGPPTLQRYATLIEEGVRAALESSETPANVELLVRDDGGDPTGVGGLIRQLESDSVVAVIGPLLDDLLDGAASARATPLPFVSPTALTVQGEAGIFSLGAPDPGSAETLARYAAASGLEYVVVIHPDEPNATFQAQAFLETFQELRGSILRTLTYPPGTTYFEEVLRQAEALSPDALFFPAPAGDIEALAPQVSFFGLDTLGVNVLGSSDWASEDVLRAVSPRHTNGVVTTAPRMPGPPSEAYQGFVRAYEERFQRSLRDPLPATGYDAASLILFAVRTGARTAAEVRTALASIQGFEGATGVLSVEDGRVVREHHLLCIQNGQLLPIEPGQTSIHYRPTRPGDPEEDEPEIVPTGPLEVYCPGAVPEEVLDSIG
jgi:branched-chain amino acid transport system substrate-binding protein